MLMPDRKGLSCAVTGFVSPDAGSVASANAVLLRGLLENGNHITFFSKPNFVDPRPMLGAWLKSGRFEFHDCTNAFQDGLRQKLSASENGLWGRFWGSYDARSYNRLLVRRMRSYQTAEIDLWLGDWARGTGTRPVVSFVQGPPGTDARSVMTRRALIERLSGRVFWLKLASAARWRLGVGLPPMTFSDHVIVGSKWSRQILIDQYQFPANRTHSLPYPIDLSAFRPSADRRSIFGPLRLLWLGRFVPRKRLDLFLDGLHLAIENGIDVEAWIIGSSGFAPGFEKLLAEFPFRDRLQHWSSLPRQKVPTLLADVDVLAQPSDEENFGSSVAEALACGVPAIVGSTNGTGDYICQRSIQLKDDKPATMAAAIARMAEAKKRGELSDPHVSRAAAEEYFDPKRVTTQLESILRLAVDEERDSAVEHGDET